MGGEFEGKKWWGVWGGWVVGLLVLEEVVLSLEAAAVAGEGAVFSDDAVAGDDDGDGVAAVGGADGAGGGGFAAEGGLLAVAAGLAVGDFKEGLPGGFLKGGADEV